MNINWLAFPGFALFFMILFVPYAYQSFKIVLLFITLSIIVLNIFSRNGKIHLHPKILLFTFFYAIIGLIFVFLGIMHDAPGALPVAQVYVVWPIIYLVLIAAVVDERILWGIQKVMVIAAFAISIYIIVIVMAQLSFLPSSVIFKIYQDQAVTFYKGYVDMVMHSISSLIFLVPFLMAALVVFPQHNWPIKRKWLWFALIFSIFVVPISGRRALMISATTAPLVILSLLLFLPPSIRKHSYKQLIRVTGLIAIIFIVIGLYVFFERSWDPLKLIRMVLNGVDASNNVGAMLRREQFYSLINGWIKYPLFGAGLGSNVSFIRSETMPWSYELYYLLLFYSTGIIGFALYLFGVLWILWTGTRMIYSGNELGIQILPILVGLISFLLASIFNPYLPKFDGIWVIFLPLMFINHWLLKKTSSNEQKGVKYAE